MNPWWIHHCAGTLEPESDPYSEEYIPLHSELDIGGVILAIVLCILYITVAVGGIIASIHVFFHNYLFGTLSVLAIFVMYVWALVKTLSKIDFYN